MPTKSWNQLISIAQDESVKREDRIAAYNELQKMFDYDYEYAEGEVYRLWANREHDMAILAKDLRIMFVE
jgi:hypothetical protein